MIHTSFTLLGNFYESSILIVYSRNLTCINSFSPHGNLQSTYYPYFVYEEREAHKYKETH